jgi:hypothetical protein
MIGGSARSGMDRMNANASFVASIADIDRAALASDYLEGAGAVASFLGWNVRKVRYARETGALPIRVKQGIGLYAFKSELVAALKTPESLSMTSQTKFQSRV